jgi:hypothetical protein
MFAAATQVPGMPNGQLLVLLRLPNTKLPSQIKIIPSCPENPGIMIDVLIRVSSSL